MVWTKLAYLSLPEALLPHKVGKKWFGALIGAKYRSTLKREFLKAGVPWEYDQVKFKRPGSMHPFEKAPKTPKKIEQRAIRVTMIKRALARQDDLQLKYRQETANKKRLTGIDFMFQSSLGNFLKNK